MIRRFSTITLSIGFALVVSFAQPLLASTVLYRTDAQLIALSERVVHARVVAQRVTRGPDGLTIYTVTTMAVLEDFTGQAGDTIEAWELGGVIGSEMLYVGGGVTYTVGREVLVCLEQGPHGMRSIAMGFSKFDVGTGAGGEVVLRRNARDTLVVGGRPPTAERTLDEFRRLAVTVTGRTSRRRATGLPADQQPADAPFTLFQGGWRWTQPDTGTPVAWYRNTTAAPPVAGDGVAEIQTALAAWTNPTSASIILQYAGTTSQTTNPRGPWTGIPSASGVITFEDPNGEISGLTLALGGGSAEVGTGGTIGGITFNRFTSGYVIFQNAADMDPQFRASVGFARVLEHEIGHTIGLGHTDDDLAVVNPEANIMNSACCYPETPTPPAIGPDDLAGINFIYPSNPTGPQMSLDKTTLNFGAVTNGATLLSQTSAQIVRLTQTGVGMVTWTATSNQPWLQVSPASGSGSADLSIGVVSSGGLPVTGTLNGAISVTFVGASNSPGPINVGLKLFFNGTSLNPFGNVDTPTDNQTGVTGAVPFTGWALDDIEVTRVTVCRAAFGAEVAPVDPNCGGAAQIFVGFAVFIDGARPDVAGVYSTYPANTKGGWGFMVLTNMLPSQGNGTFQFFMWARDPEGHAVVLGTRTLTCDNAHATKPFGAIDTPTQGGVASGANFAVFGWVLSRVAHADPPGGGTVTVLVDSVAVGSPGGWAARSDLTALFPGFPGINNALGVYGLNTSTYSNGIHTIVWVVTDSAGMTEGIGSRYFTVSNGAGALTAAPTADVDLPVTADPTPIVGRRGWVLDAPLRLFPPDASGRAVIRSEEVNRVELQLGPGWIEGYLRTHDGLATLPAGSHLDGETGVFTWAPGVGYVGAYDFVFVRREGNEPAVRREVRIILQPKASGAVGPQVVIDTPRTQQDVGQPFVLAGWAADLDAAQGTGIATLHAWAYPLTGGPPVFLGATAYGGARPDVAAVHGDQFEASGFGLYVQGLTPGNYDLAVFAWSTERADFVPARMVRVTVRP